MTKKNKTSTPFRKWKKKIIVWMKELVNTKDGRDFLSELRTRGEGKKWLDLGELIREKWSTCAHYEDEDLNDQSQLVSMWRFMDKWLRNNSDVYTNNKRQPTTQHMLLKERSHITKWLRDLLNKNDNKDFHRQLKTYVDAGDWMGFAGALRERWLSEGHPETSMMTQLDSTYSNNNKEHLQHIWSHGDPTNMSKGNNLLLWLKNLLQSNGTEEVLWDRLSEQGNMKDWNQFADIIRTRWISQGNPEDHEDLNILKHSPKYCAHVWESIKTRRLHRTDTDTTTDRGTLKTAKIAVCQWLQDYITTNSDEDDDDDVKKSFCEELRKAGGVEDWCRFAVVVSKRYIEAGHSEKDTLCMLNKKDKKGNKYNCKNIWAAIKCHL